MCEGRICVVTGAGRGIGREHSLMLAEQGAKVVVNDLGGDMDGSGTPTTGPALDVVNEIKAMGGDAVANGDDIASCDGAERLIKTAIETFGGLDVLINNAGIAGPTGGIDEIEASDWEKTVDINLNSHFQFTRRAVPKLRQAADGGVIVFISSVAGRLGYGFRTPYSATKWAVVGLAKSLAIELGPDNIRVNAVQPGIVKGPRMEGVIAARAKQLGISYEDMEARYLEKISLRRMVTQEEVAASVLFLASPAGSAISGQALSVCGNVETL